MLTVHTKSVLDLSLVLPTKLLGLMLIWASEHGDVDAIMKLAAKNVDMNFRDEVSEMN